METLFSAFNGVFMGLAILAAPVVAITGVGASPFELTLIICAFPVGAFLGPLWAGLGRRWGMKRLVTLMAVWGNLPMLAIGLVHDSVAFTVLVVLCQLMNSAMRMGQASLYGELYSHAIRGRVLGRLTCWTYLTMVPSILVVGLFLEVNAESYRVIYPLGGLCGLVAAWFYHRIVLAHGVAAVPSRRLTLGQRYHEVRGVFRNDRAYGLLQVIFFLCGSSYFLTVHVVLLLARDELGMSPRELAIWLSVAPQLLLALSSPFWGKIYDRLGMGRCRLLIGVLFTAYLASYFAGVMTGVSALLVLGSVLLGVGNGGGQVTWALASAHFAPRPEDVPMYNGIHFVLNGVRGLLMPWIGAGLFLLVGPWCVLAGVGLALASIPVTFRLMRALPGGVPSPLPALPPDGRAPCPGRPAGSLPGRPRLVARQKECV
jgi:MFS family permease